MGFFKVGCALSLILGLPAIAQSRGKFLVTGPMVTDAGSGHSATLLVNGKVLIAGGSGEYSKYVIANRLGQDTWRGAEVYDPSSGTFAPTGRMVQPRMVHAAVALPDGRVLIVGGQGPWDSATRDVPLFDSAEIYDPRTDSFSATDRMTSMERCIKAVLLGNGNVLIVGGPKALTDPPSAVPAQLFDPTAGTFTSSRGTHVTAGSTFGACPTSVTLLPDGKVLIPWNLGDAEIYDPIDDAFTLAWGRRWENGLSTTQTLLMNGSVLLTGGNGPFDDDTQFGYGSAETYDPSSSTFAAAPNMNVQRYDHTATLLPDGAVLIAGTNRSGVGVANGLSAGELYGTETGTFFETLPMVTPRYGHTATLLADGSVLMAGGLGVSTGATAERYYPAGMMPSASLLTIDGDSHQGAILHAGTAQIASSTNPAVPDEVLEIYCTGLADGSVIPPQVSIGGRLSEVLWFDNASGYANLNHVHVRVPEGVAPGPSVPVRLTYITRPSNEVTIGVR